MHNQRLDGGCPGGHTGGDRGRDVVDGIGPAWADNDPDAFADVYTTDANMILSGDRLAAARAMSQRDGC